VVGDENERAGAGEILQAADPDPDAGAPEEQFGPIMGGDPEGAGLAPAKGEKEKSDGRPDEKRDDRYGVDQDGPDKTDDDHDYSIPEGIIG
jgi:hypothetical protein